VGREEVALDLADGAEHEEAREALVEGTVEAMAAEAVGASEVNSVNLGSSAAETEAVAMARAAQTAEAAERAAAVGRTKSPPGWERVRVRVSAKLRERCSDGVEDQGAEEALWGMEPSNQSSPFWKEPSHASGSSFQRGERRRDEKVANRPGRGLG
jgi:hypothetical protein